MQSHDLAYVLHPYTNARAMERQGKAIGRPTKKFISRIGGYHGIADEP